MIAGLRQRVLFRYRLAVICVLGLTAALFFARLGERALWSEEVRWAEIPREMQRSGDYFRPTFNGRVYYDKPLGSYWMVLAASAVTGRIDELTARLPSAIGAFAAVVLVMLLTRRLYDRRIAALAGAILATSFAFTNFARTASADAETVAGVLAALWLFVRNDGRVGRWLYAFWLVMAVTSLTKGLLGFVLPLLVAGVYSLASGGVYPRREQPGGDKPRRSPFESLAIAFDWLLNWRTLVAAPLAAAVYLTPFVISQGSGDMMAGLRMVCARMFNGFTTRSTTGGRCICTATSFWNCWRRGR